MKCSIKDMGFNPIDLTITLESLEDVKALWSALNIAPAVLQRHGEAVGYTAHGDSLTYHAWLEVDKLARELGLRHDE